MAARINELWVVTKEPRGWEEFEGKFRQGWYKCKICPSQSYIYKSCYEVLNGSEEVCVDGLQKAGNRTLHQMESCDRIYVTLIFKKNFLSVTNSFQATFPLKLRVSKCLWNKQCGNGPHQYEFYLWCLNKNCWLKEVEGHATETKEKHGCHLFEKQKLPTVFMIPPGRKVEFHMCTAGVRLGAKDDNIWSAYWLFPELWEPCQANTNSWAWLLNLETENLMNAYSSEKHCMNFLCV